MVHNLHFADDVIKKGCERRTLKGKSVTLHRLGKPDGLIIQNLHSDASHMLLEMYFENILSRECDVTLNSDFNLAVIEGVLANGNIAYW